MLAHRNSNQKKTMNSIYWLVSIERDMKGAHRGWWNLWCLLAPVAEGSIGILRHIWSWEARRVGAGAQFAMALRSMGRDPWGRADPGILFRLWRSSVRVREPAFRDGRPTELLSSRNQPHPLPTASSHHYVFTRL